MQEGLVTDGFDEIDDALDERSLAGAARSALALQVFGSNACDEFASAIGRELIGVGLGQRKLDTIADDR